MAENFSSSDPGINIPHVHGSVDSGGGLVSFLNVSENLIKKKKKICFFFLLTVYLSLSLFLLLFFFCWCFIYNY